MTVAPDLRAVLTIQHMAETAAGTNEQPGSDEGAEIAAAYARVREEARRLNDRAGWDADAFERAVPPAPDDWRNPPQSRREVDAYEMTLRGRRARVLLLSLAGWARGNAVAFELEQTFVADAEIRAARKREENRPRAGLV